MRLLATILAAILGIAPAAATGDPAATGDAAAATGAGAMGDAAAARGAEAMLTGTPRHAAAGAELRDPTALPPPASAPEVTASLAALYEASGLPAGPAAAVADPPTEIADGVAVLLAGLAAALDAPDSSPDPRDGPDVPDTGVARDTATSPDTRDTELVRAVRVARGLLEDAVFDGTWSDPLGLVQVGGSGDDVYEGNRVHELDLLPPGTAFDARATLLTVDLGGDDVYRNRAGTAAPVVVDHSERFEELRHALLLALVEVQLVVFEILAGEGEPGDLEGAARDLEEAVVSYAEDVVDDPDPSTAVGRVTFGVPVSLSLDLAGDDRYEGDGPSQGAGVGGVGVLVDLAGDDRYDTTTTGQGAAIDGLGLLLDAGGHDRYRLDAAGQGYSFGRGRARLVDLAGDDRYRASTSAQGVGAAQGLGVLHDADGDDEYRAGLLGIGVGLASGLGVLVDQAGDDRYNPIELPPIDDAPDLEALAEELARALAEGLAGLAVGSGLVGGEGHVLDAEGDDVYGSTVLGVSTTLVSGSGTVADAGGDDTYEVFALGGGAALAGGTATIVDADGDDRHACIGFCQAASLGLAAAGAELRDLAGDDEHECVLGCQAVAAGITPGASARADLVDAAGHDAHRAVLGWAHGFGGDPTGQLGAGEARFVDGLGDDEYEGSPGADGTSWEQGDGGSGHDLG